jgi:TolB-like protein/Tfp pilus assembly protein PilF
MKTCPKCHREYTDEALNFCLDDGEWLHPDEPATAILTSESPTRIHNTQNSLSDSSSITAENTASNKKKLLAAGILGILLVAVVAIGAYWIYGTRTVKQIGSIAVLPFVNKSGDPNSEYLSDGLAESLIYRLSQLPDLKVSPTSSVIRYKGKDTDVPTIAKELGVDAVMTGRLAQFGDNLTISVELVDVRNNKLLWGRQYDRRMDDLLATQREIAAAIAENLQLRLSGDDAKGLVKQYTNNNEAYQFYLKGRYFWAKRTPESVTKAIDQFNLAIEKDPRFALAYSGLADAYVVPTNPMAPLEKMPKAKAAATRALEIDDTLAECHTSQARVLHVFDWNWKEAEKEYKRAVELNPRYPVVHQWYGGLLEKTGRFDEAISARKLALELDPLDVTISFELGQAFYFARDYDRAIEQFQKALELDPGFLPVSLYLPAAYLQAGKHEEAVARIETTPESSVEGAGRLGFVYGVTGRTNEARKILAEFKRLRGQQYVSAGNIAMIHVGLGENDEALAWLEKGYEERAYSIQNLKVDPVWDRLRADPRFNDLLRRVGLTP